MAVNAYLSPLLFPSGTEIPGTMQGLANLLAQYLAVSGLSELGGINFGPTTPSEANRDKPWFKTDSSFNPIGFFSWNGSAWVTFDTGAIPSGPTASRLTSPAVGQLYFDTDIKCVLIWERAKWRTADGSPGDVKFVKATDVATAIVNNPGWVEDTVGQNYVIAGASATHTYGTTAGAETHQLITAELPAHTHTITAPLASNADNGAPGPYIPTAPDQQTATPAFNGTSSSTGSGTAHNNLQPTRYLWCLVKE
jgi:hypothetical protein